MELKMIRGLVVVGLTAGLFACSSQSTIGGGSSAGIPSGGGFPSGASGSPDSVIYAI